MEHFYCACCAENGRKPEVGLNLRMRCDVCDSDIVVPLARPCIQAWRRFATTEQPVAHVPYADR